MQQPIEVQVDEHEPIVERVAAIDVAKASGMVCLRIPHETIPDRRVTKVWPVAATTAALVELGDHLRCERVTRVVVESTSDYWRPFYYLLEAAGLIVWLVNAAQVKNVPGRPKTDKIECGWRNSPSGRCCPRRWCPPSRCARCGIWPGPATTWSRTAPGSSSGSRSCSRTP
jgi:transposase